MTERDHIRVIEDAADRIADISRADLQIMLRRTAIRLRNSQKIGFDNQIELSLGAVASELGLSRAAMVQMIVKEWLERQMYLPVRVLDEGGDVNGYA
jgi:hypothetical protein